MSHHHHHHHSEKNLALTVILNIIITVAELIGGIMSGSLALLSDAAHNASDVLSLITGWVGEKVSKNKASKTYSFGLKRVEILTAFINASSLIIIAVWIIYEALERYKIEQTISLSIMIPVALIGLAGNAASIILLHAHHNQSLNMKAAYLHLLYDTISSVLVIISGIVIYLTKLYIFDIIMSIIIAILMLYSSLGIIKDVFYIFLQKVPSNMSFDTVHKYILSISGVNNVHDLHIWAINSSQNVLTCHIVINENECSDTILSNVNTTLTKNYQNLHTTIQIEKKNLCNESMLCKH